MSPPVAEATHRSQPDLASGGETARGFTYRILEFCAENSVDLSWSKATRLGTRMKRRADLMQEEFDFDRELRVLGIYRDPTAADAIYNVERNVATASQT